MPKSCCVPGCTAHKSAGYPDRKFYILPQATRRRTKWLTAINRAHKNVDGSVDKGKLWSPKTSHVYVCSAHFVSGEKVNDECHPDYVPSIFPSRKDASGIDAKLDRYDRLVKRVNRKPSPRKKLYSRQVKADGKDIQQESQQDVVMAESNVVEEELASSAPSDNPEELVSPAQTDNPDTPRLEDNSYEENKQHTLPIDKPLPESERRQLYEEITNLRKERDDALARVAFLEKVVNSSSLSASSVEDDNEACKMMTGISWDVFLKLFLFLSTFLSVKDINMHSVSIKDQLFLTLVKLKHNVTFEFLARLKGIPKTTMIDYFWKWIELLHSKISFLVKWPDRDTVFKSIPPVFKAKFPRLTSIVDCFEIFIDAPRNLLARAQCYSSYKKHCTIKFFISCTPLGCINFLSKAWGGRATDNNIVRESGFISPKFHLPSDQILADRGFTLQEDFATFCGAELLLPSFKKGKKQLSAKEVETSRNISSVRIHIERVIGLLKNRYTILRGPLPIQSVKGLKDESLQSTLARCDKIIAVCAALVNLGEGIIFQ